MATVIDSLIVELGLDPKGFDAGRKKAVEDFLKTRDQADRTAKDMEERGKRAAQFFSQIRGQVIALFAVFTAGKGLKDFVQDVTRSEVATGMLSRQLDTTVESLSAWRGAAVQAGGTADGVTASMQGLVGEFQNFALTGESSVIPYFRALGVSIADSQGHMRDVGDVMLDLADKFQQLDPARAAAFGKALGFDSGTIALLSQGRDAVQQMLNEQRQWGVITKEDAAAGLGFHKALFGLESASSRVGITLLTKFTPALIAVLNALTRLSEWAQNNEPIVEAAFVALTAVVLTLSTAMAVNFAIGAVGAMTTAFGTIVAWVPEVALALAVLTDTTLPALSAAFLAVGVAIEATPIGWILTGIAALSVAAYELYEHWNEIGPWWRKLWDTIWNATKNPNSKDANDWADFVDIASGNVESYQYRHRNDGNAKPGSKSTTSGIPAEGRNLLDTIAGSEGANYNTLYGGGTFSDFSKAPNAGRVIRSGPNAGRMTHAWGRYQFEPGTWADAVKALGLKDASPASQDKAGWWLAQRDYKARTGRDLLTDLRSGNPEMLGFIGQALSGTWTSLPGGIESRRTLGQFSGALAGRQAAIDKRSTRTVTTHIGKIEVRTAATDAAGIARSIKPALERNTFSEQANYGTA